MQPDKFILRTPLLKISDLVCTEEALLKAYAEPSVRQALFIASRDLFNELNKLEANEITDKEKRSRILISLYKYHTRMCTRCTPFGLFSGISTGNIAATTDIRLSGSMQPRIRLDMDYLCNLFYDLSKDVSTFPGLEFYPNNTLYKVYDQWRFVEYQVKESGVLHNLVSIDDNELLTKILTATGGGQTCTQLVNTVMDFGFEEAEATAYVMELILSQVLVSQLYPSVTGVEYQHRILGALEQLFPGKYPCISQKVAGLLNTEKEITATIGDLEQTLSGYGIRIKSGNLVQVDLFKQTDQCTLDRTIVNRVEEATHLLARLMIMNQSQNHLERFKKAFYERYEDAFMPLPQVMDTDIGIGYKNAVSISDRSASNEKTAHEKRIRAFKMKLFKRGLLSGSGIVEITRDEARDILEKSSVSFPESYSFLGSLLRDSDGQTLIRYKSAGGASAIDILGRFGHLHPDINRLCQDVAAAERKKLPGAILAEIIHLPQGKIGNVITRPHYHAYEIPYLCHSALPEEQQIAVSDLYIGLVNFRLVLYSKKLGKEIIPRLNNAHNYLFDSLPLYNFLCDLQNQKKEINFFWSWDDLQHEEFLPRITYKNIVLSQARWNLDTTPFKKMNYDKDRAVFYEKIKQVGLPDTFVLIQGDNELYIDIRSALGATTFLRYCQKRDVLSLEEFIPTDQSISGGFANEIIIPYLGEAVSASSVGVQNLPPTAMEQQMYSPMSEWVFFKLYTGKKYIGKMLTEIVPDMIDELKEAGIISRWFYIRYSDPKDHLRIRFLLPDTGQKGLLLEIVNRHLHILMQEQIIWDMQIGTYRRELNRYGYNTMEESEEWFYHNSELVLAVLQLIRESEGKNVLFFAMYYTDALLNCFYTDAASKFEFLSAQSAMYNTEFGVDNDKDLRIGLNNEFRKINGQLRDMLYSGFLHFDNTDGRLKNLCCLNLENTRGTIESLKHHYSGNKGKMESIIASYIHMFINRLFVTNQRYHEMTVYYFLSKYYASEIVRKTTKDAIVHY